MRHRGVEVRRVTEEAIGQIRAVAAVAFPATYRELLTPAQLDYMMEWMYSRRASANSSARGMSGLWPSPAVFRAAMSRSSGRVRTFSTCRRSMCCPLSGDGHRRPPLPAGGCACRAEHPGRSLMELNVNRRNRALHFYERMGMRRLREGDFPIGGGFTYERLHHGGSISSSLRGRQGLRGFGLLGRRGRRDRCGKRPARVGQTGIRLTGTAGRSGGPGRGLREVSAGDRTRGGIDRRIPPASATPFFVLERSISPFSTLR